VTTFAWVWLAGFLLLIGLLLVGNARNPEEPLPPAVVILLAVWPVWSVLLLLAVIVAAVTGFLSGPWGRERGGNEESNGNEGSNEK
jgi:vacuolar-type H+-ATPase subunit I/STV1